MTYVDAASTKVLVSGVWQDAEVRVKSGGSFPGSPAEILVPGTGVFETPWLPWNLLPSYSDTKGVWPHYFTQFLPIMNSVQPAVGAPDYYDQFWAPPGHVEFGTNHAYYGGYTRDHPKRMPYFGGSQQNFKTKAMKVEVRQAIQAGVDGFTIDILANSLTQYHWQHITWLFDAVDQVNTEDGTTFTLWLMMDGTSATGLDAGGTTLTDKINASADRMATCIASVLNRSCYQYRDGHPALGVFGAELWPGGTAGVDTSNNPATNSRVAYWSRVKSKLLALTGKSVNLWACYVGDWTLSTTSGVFDGIMYGHGRWGDRDAVAVATNNNANRLAPSHAHALYPTKKWLHFAAPYDTRPYSGGANSTPGTYYTWEGEGSLTLHGSFRAAIDGGADGIQMTTWNDYSENAHIAPSEHHGYAYLDIASSYIHEFKQGAQPTVVRDGTYLFHRQYNNATVHPTGANGQVKWSAIHGATPVKNIVEVLAYLVTPATVELLLDGVVVATWSGAAGRNRFENPMPTSGSVLSCRVKRSGSVVPGSVATSPKPLVWSISYDDFTYFAASSLRQSTGQGAGGVV